MHECTYTVTQVLHRCWIALTQVQMLKCHVTLQEAEPVLPADAALPIQIWLHPPATLPKPPHGVSRFWVHAQAQHIALMYCPTRHSCILHHCICKEYCTSCHALHLINGQNACTDTVLTKIVRTEQKLYELGCKVTLHWSATQMQIFFILSQHNTQLSSKV